MPDGSIRGVVLDFGGVMTTCATPERVREGRARIQQLLAEAEPVTEPHFVWVNAKDEPYLLESPAKRGGRLVFENPSVRVYGF